MTEAEYREPAAWLDRNFDRLMKTCTEASLEFHDLCGHRYSVTMNDTFKSLVLEGPRGLDAGEVAEHLRTLRDRYPESAASPNNVKLRAT